MIPLITDEHSITGFIIDLCTVQKINVLLFSTYYKVLVLKIEQVNKLEGNFVATFNLLKDKAVVRSIVISKSSYCFTDFQVQYAVHPRDMYLLGK